MPRQARPKTRQEAQKGTRKERIPAGTARLNLNVPEIPGYVSRWVNERDQQGDRLQRFLDGGYEFVLRNTGIIPGDTAVDGGNQDLGSRISRRVSSDGMKAYLMKIPKKLYDQDQKAKKKEGPDRIDQMLNLGHGAEGEGRVPVKPGDIVFE